MRDKIRRNGWAIWLGTSAIAVMLSACGGGGGGSRGGADIGGGLLLNEGVTVHRVSADDGLARFASASVPAAQVAEGDDIFGLLLHPTKPWLYATVLSNCEVGSCWGNARVERFELVAGGVRYAGPAFNYLAQGGGIASCVNVEEGEDFCAPVNGTFSADGAWLYLKDDDADVLHQFSVDQGTGALTLLHESAPVDMHGLTIHPEGSYLYNGSNTIDIQNEDDVRLIFQGSGGNDTQIVGIDDGLLLFTTGNTDHARVLSLLEPVAPQLIDEVNLGSHRSRAMAVTADGARVIAVGRNLVTSLLFDGETLAVQQALDVSVPDAEHIENRAVVWVEDGSLVAVAWFQRDEMAPSGQVGGLVLYSLDEDGVLTQEGVLETGAASRALIRLK